MSSCNAITFTDIIEHCVMILKAKIMFLINIYFRQLLILFGSQGHSTNKRKRTCSRITHCNNWGKHVSCHESTSLVAALVSATTKICYNFREEPRERPCANGCCGNDYEQFCCDNTLPIVGSVLGTIRYISFLIKYNIVSITIWFS